MTLIPWTNAVVQSYLAGFQVGLNLAHRVCYFSPEIGRMVSETPSDANALPVSRTALSFFRSLSQSDLERRDELVFDVTVGQRRHTFHRPPFSSLLSLETGRSRHGVALAIRHVLDSSAPAYLSSHFTVSFSGASWGMGLEDFFGVSENSKFDVILGKVFRSIGLPEDTSMDEHWGPDRQQVTMDPQPLVPGGPGVAVAFDRLRPHDAQSATRLEFSVDHVNPLGPYLPGGIFQLWRLAERMMGLGRNP